jgi:hypothetical protein
VQGSPRGEALGSSSVRPLIAALAVLFLLAHLASLPPTLEDLDSINFALGVRDFDVAKHQPHPPGYPVFVALAKASTAIVGVIGISAPAVRGLSVLSVVAGACLVPLLFALFHRLSADARVAWWGMAVVVCSPLFWFTALRPLSDMTGLALAIAAQVLLLNALIPFDRNRRALLWGAAICGLAAGVRVQTTVLTAPLLVAALVWPGTGLSVAQRAAAIGAAACGVAIWGVPLIIASGGLSNYLSALGTQAGEDFAGVVMLYTMRQARVAANAVLYSFVWPWGLLAFGVGMVMLAGVGALRAAWRMPRAFVVVAIAFGPYAVFHLLFHETITVRYALPLVVPVAFLAVVAMRGLGRAALDAAGTLIVIVSLWQTLPAARAYGRDGAPAFRAMAAPAGGAETSVVGMHAVMRRVVEWSGVDASTQVLRAPYGREWLSLVEHWRSSLDRPVRFLADPRRTDLALLDLRARARIAAERWTFPEMPFVAGTRPGAADVYVMRPPGWMLDRGWALTAEIGGVTARDGGGPHIQPSVAWVRASTGPSQLLIGGRNLGATGDPPARLTITTEREAIDTWDAAPGFFFRLVSVPASAFTGVGYVPLRVSAIAADSSGRQVPVSLEQFDLQPDGVAMLGFVEGWGEPEYNPATAAAWRWMTERAVLWVRPIGRDVTVTLRGESPLRYFDRVPNVRVSVAGGEVARFSPSSDFEQAVTIPSAALQRANGQVLVESDLWYSPADRGEADRRHLALRMYEVMVK